MKKVLVTGGGGFIGRHLIHILKLSGYDVHILTTRPQNNTKSVTFYKADLMNFPSVQEITEDVKADYLIHLAWFTEHGSFWEAKENLEWVDATTNLVKHFISNGGKRIVGAGSCAEYDWDNPVCHEIETPCNPHTLYGKSKLAAYKACKKIIDKSAASIAWARVFQIYGPYEKSNRFIPSVIKATLNQEQLVCNHPNQVRDFVYVADAAQAFLNIMESDLTGPVNIGAEHQISRKEIITMISETLGEKSTILLGDDGGKYSPTNPQSFLPDITLLKRYWTPKVSLCQGLEKTISYWSAL